MPDLDGLKPSQVDRGLIGYHGAVFNLWNAKDYKGWFFSMGFNRRETGMALFSGPKFVKGPWGVSKTIWSSSFPKMKDLPGKRSLNPTATWYQPWVITPYPSEYLVLLQILAATFLEIVFDQSGPGMINRPAILARWLIEGSYWYQVTQAKYYWNKEAKHDVQYRQTTHVDRPRDFQSGPTSIFFGI